MRNIARQFIRSAGNGYLEWRYKHLRSAFSIKSHLTYRERVTLYLLAQSTPVVAEIGSYLGASACCFGAARKRQGCGRIICVDTWANHAMSEGIQDTWQDFCDNTQDYSEYIIPIRGFSTHVVDQVQSEVSHIDLLFIDGDHTHEGAKADWEAYKKFMKIGSVIVFHDYGWAEGVRRVVHEDVIPRIDRGCKLPNMWWGRIGKVD